MTKMIENSKEASKAFQIIIIIFESIENCSRSEHQFISSINMNSKEIENISQVRPFQQIIMKKGNINMPVQIEQCWHSIT